MSEFPKKENLNFKKFIFVLYMPQTAVRMGQQATAVSKYVLQGRTSA
jgi:hypothetical protein